MCTGSDQYERMCKGEFASIQTKLDRMDEAIRGNGKPGIQTRLDRLERTDRTRCRLIWLIAASVVTLLANALWRVIVGVG